MKGHACAGGMQSCHDPGRSKSSPDRRVGYSHARGGRSVAGLAFLLLFSSSVEARIGFTAHASPGIHPAQTLRRVAPLVSASPVPGHVGARLDAGRATPGTLKESADSINVPAGTPHISSWVDADDTNSYEEGDGIWEFEEDGIVEDYPGTSFRKLLHGCHSPNSKIR